MWSCSRGLRAGLAASLGLLVITISAPGAAATSCAPHPDGSPEAIAAEQEVLAVEQPFRERYDGAVLGTVLRTRTQDDSNRPDYGRTIVVMDVLGALGPRLPEQVDIVEPDPGWMNGFGLQAGQHYFVPYVIDGGDLKSFVCDPISVVDPSTVTDLVAVADEHPWPDDQLKTIPPEAVSHGDDASATVQDAAQGSRWPVLAVAVAGLVTLAVGVGLARIALRRSASSQH